VVLFKTFYILNTIVKWLFMFCLLLVSNHVNAWDDWTQEQKNWFIASNVAIAADWATTRNMTRRYNEGYYERNLIMGRYPSKERVDIHFLSWITANYFIADYLSTKNRTIYLQLVTGVHGIAATNNLRIGLKLQF
jgi:hypothetical protein